MSDLSLDAEYKQRMEGKETARFAQDNAEALTGLPVHLEATIPPKSNPDMNPGNRRTDAELAAMGKAYPTPTPSQEALSNEPPPAAILKKGLEVVGQAGKDVMAAASPLLDVAGKTLGLELPKGGAEKAVSFVAGLPEGNQNDTAAGIATLLTALPVLGFAKQSVKHVEAIVKANPNFGDALGALLKNRTVTPNPSATNAYASTTPLEKVAKPITKEQLRKEVLGLADEFATTPAPHTPIPDEKVTKMAEDSVADLYTSGGSTVNATRGNMRGAPAYAVATLPEHRAYVKGHPTAQDMKKYIKDLAGKVDLDNGLYSVGTWFDASKGTTEMSVSLTFDHLDEALQVAQATGEYSIYSLGSGTEIITPPKGQAGKVNIRAAVALASALAGGAYGYAVGEPDEKIISALKFAGLAALAPVAIPLAKPMLRGTVAKVGKGMGEAALTKAEMATPLAQIAKDYRAKVADFSRGHISHAASREAGAAKLAAGDLSDEYLLTRNPGAVYNEASMAAMKEVLVQEGEKLKGFANAYMVNPSDKAMEEQFLKQFATYAHIDPLDVGLEAESGRALSFLNDQENEVNQFTRRMSGIVSKVRVTQSPLRMAQMVNASPSLTQLSDFTRRTTAPGLVDMVAESWINGLVSQPITHVTNTTSNLITILTSIPERAVAQGFGALTPGPAGVVAGETSALVRGYLHSSQIAWTAALKAFRTEESGFGATKMETRRHAISQHNFDQLLDRAGVPALAGSWTKMFDYIGTAARVPGRLLLGEDEFFKGIAFGGESSAQAWRAATLDVGSTGITGKALREGIDLRYNQIMADPEQLGAFAKDAEEFAHYMTFTKDLGEAGQDIQRLARHTLGRFVLPFVRTPINIAKYAGERTPFAIASKAVRDDIAKGGATRDLALAKIATGSSVMVTFGMFAAAGVITGFGPSDKETRALWQTDGRKPYSVNATALARMAKGGDPAPKMGDQWFTYSRIDPVGMLIGLSADGTDVLTNIDDPEVADHLASRLTLIASHVVASKTYVKGIAEWMFAASDPEHYGGKLEQSLARTLLTTIPAVGPVLKMTQRATDPIVRETHGVMDAIKSTVPGWSTTLPPKRNYWGEVQLREGWQVGGVGIENALTPLYRSTHFEDPLVKALVESRVNLTPPRDTIGLVRLNPVQYDYLRSRFGEVTEGGKNVHAAMEDVLSKFPTPTTDPQSMLHVLLKATERRYELLAREDMYKKFPELRGATGRTQAIEKMRSRSNPPPAHGVKEITVE